MVGEHTFAPKDAGRCPWWSIQKPLEKQCIILYFPFAPQIDLLLHPKLDQLRIQKCDPIATQNETPLGPKLDAFGALNGSHFGSKKDTPLCARWDPMDQGMVPKLMYPHSTHENEDGDPGGAPQSSCK